MAKVILGSASIDENGKAHGGAAGDQTGKEVRTQNWYKHSKGWRVLRPKSAAIAEKIAAAMQAACDNNNIGYDQYQRDTLLKVAAASNPVYWPGGVKTKTETDCSALVRVCVAYACGQDVIGSVIGSTRFSTANQCSMMLKTGLFDEMVGSQYTDQDAFLLRGDVLVTRTQGHTVVALSNGSKATPRKAEPQTGLKTLHKGDSGELVKQMQELLLQHDPVCLLRFGADGDFGSETHVALMEFQIDMGLDDTGICDEATWKALESNMKLRQIIVTGGQVNIRSGVGTKASVVRVARSGEVLEFSETDKNSDGVTWYHVPDGWISGKFAKLK